MSILHPSHQPSGQRLDGPPGPEVDFLQGFDATNDPVEAYFECITQCSLDDGECVTVCTSILREQT